MSDSADVANVPPVLPPVTTDPLAQNVAADTTNIPPELEPETMKPIAQTVAAKIELPQAESKSMSMLPSPPPSELERLEQERGKVEQRLASSAQFSDLVGTVGFLYGLMAFVVVLVFANTIFDLVADSQFQQFAILIGYGGRVLSLWILIAAFVFSFLGISLFRTRTWRRKLNQIDERIQILRTANLEGRLDYLQEELRRLTIKVGSVFLDNPFRSRQANTWRSEAEGILDRMEDWQKGIRIDAKKPDLGTAQTLINSINELVLREKNDLRAQRNWQFVAVGIMLAYIALLFGVASAASGTSSDQKVPLYGVPLSVLMWGAAGSLAAILYKFYTARRRVRFEVEVRWLIARPIIGIIMSGVTYLAIAAGLVFLSNGSTNNTGTPPAVPPGNIEVYWILAFLAGFSDKFYLRIIDLLVGKTVGEIGEESEQPTNQEEQASKIGESTVLDLSKV